MLIQTEDQFDRLLQELTTQPRLAIDTETHKHNDWDSKKIIGVSIAWKKEDKLRAVYLPFRHVIGGLNFGEANLPIEYLTELGPVIGREDLITDWWGAKFDLKMFRKDDIEINGTIRCGMVISALVCEWGTHALKEFGDQVFGLDSSFEQKKLKEIEKAIGCWEKIPPVVMGKYAEKDGTLTWNSIDYLLTLTDKQEITHLIPAYMETLRILVDMEYRGLKIKRAVTQDLSRQAKARLEELQAELGYDCMKSNQLIHRLFASPPEGLGLPVGELGKPSKSFPKGKPVTDRATLLRYRHPDIPKILETRSLVKANSTWFEGFLRACDKDDRVHAEWRQHGCVTSRLSCKQPNLQQLPRVKEEEVEQGVTQKLVKTMLDVTDGYELYEFDYSQQEFRLAGVYAQDQGILGAYRNNSDMHLATAEKLNLTRHDAKTLNFTILFGGGPNKVKEALGISYGQAKELIDEFWTQYPALARFVEAATNAATARGWVKYWDGTRRHFQYSSEYHKAQNSIIQGGGAQMIFESMRQIKRANLDSHMVSQVHDSIWLEIPKNNVEVEQKNIKSCMEDWTVDKFGLLFPTDVKRLA